MSQASAFLATCPADLRRELTAALANYTSHAARLAVLEKWGFSDPTCVLATFAIVADTGVIGEEVARDAVAAMVESWGPDAVFHVGDVRYEDTPTVDEALDAALSPYNWAIEAEKFYAILGNHDRSNDVNGAKLMARMPYIYESEVIPEFRTYYNVLWEKADFEGFFLDTAIKNDGSQIEPRLFPDWPNGTPGSDQYAWLVDQLKLSRAKWKWVFAHHGFVTIEAGATYPDFATGTDLHYPELGVDGLVNGNSHTNVHFSQRSMPILTVASSDVNNVDVDGDLTGTSDALITTVWFDKSATNKGRPSAIKMTIRPFDMIIEFIVAETEFVSHTAIIPKRHGQLRL